MFSIRLIRHAAIAGLTAVLMIPLVASARDIPTSGPILADPDELSTSVSLDYVLSISTFFNDPANKVKIQFPSPETQFAWVNISKYYPTAQVIGIGQDGSAGWAVACRGN